MTTNHGVQMTRRWQLILVGSLGLSVACASPSPGAKSAAKPAAKPAPKTPKLNWSLFSTPSAEVQLELPGDPEQLQSAQSTALGMAEITQYLVDVSGTTFGLIVTQYEKGAMAEAFPQEILSSARTTVLNNIDGDLVTEEKNSWTLPEDSTKVFPGRRIEATTSIGLYYRCQWYQIEDAVYQIMLMSPKEQDTSAAFSRMVESFRIYLD